MKLTAFLVFVLALCVLTDVALWLIRLAIGTYLLSVLFGWFKG